MTPARPIRRAAATARMSVYTPVTAPDLDAWLTRYAVGALAELAPIASGIENTNYFVTTERGRFVLTLYERLPAAELPFYLNLMAHLARAGVRSSGTGARSHRRAVLAAERQARRTRRARRRRAGRSTRRRRIARRSAPRSRGCTSRRRPIARASRTAAGPRGGAQAARAVQPYPRRRRRPRCSTPRSSSRPDSAAASCPRARSTATSSATTCCSPAIAWPASSTSASPPPTSSRTTSRSPSTTGACDGDGSARSGARARDGRAPTTRCAR